MFKKIKKTFSEIKWPSVDNITKRTNICVVVTIILAVILAAWAAGIEKLVSLIIP